MTVAKRKRATLKDSEDFLKYEPYKSIMYAIKSAPDYCKEFKGGLETKELRYLIVKGYDVETGQGFRKRKGEKNKTLIEAYKKELEWNPKIKLNQKISTTHQGFNKYLKKLEARGWIRRKKSRILLDEKHRYEYLRFLKEKIIKKYPLKNILPERDFIFYLPKSITVDRFTKEDRIQFNKIANYSLSSLEKIIKKIRDEKKREIWDKKIINSDRVNPLVKLYLWVHQFTDTICLRSPKIFLSVTTEKLKTNMGILPREKAIDEWKKQEINLRREIFNDTLNDLWHDKNISAEDEKQVNFLLKEGYEESYLYFMDIVNEIQTDPREEYAFLISPIVLGEEIQRQNKNTEYMKSIPWLNPRWRKWDDKVTEAVNYIRSENKQLGLIDTKEVEIAGIKTKWESIKTDEEEKPIIPCDTSLESIGKTWFNHFNSDLRNKLLDFCIDLGYKNEKQLFKVIGEFASIFHLPYIPNPQDMLKSSREGAVCK